MTSKPNDNRPTDEQLQAAIQLLMNPPSGSQANGTRGHTADTRLTWPRCYPHHDTCLCDHTCPGATEHACKHAAERLSRASLSLKYYQHLGIDQLSVHHR